MECVDLAYVNIASLVFVCVLWCRCRSLTLIYLMVAYAVNLVIDYNFDFGCFYALDSYEAVSIYHNVKCSMYMACTFLFLRSLDKLSYILSSCMVAQCLASLFMSVNAYLSVEFDMVYNIHVMFQTAIFFCELGVATLLCLRGGEWLRKL